MPSSAWVCHLPNDFNSASVPSASLCFFYNHHFYSPIHFVCTAHHIHLSFEPSLHWQPSSLTQACLFHQNNNNRWMKSWASSLFIINAFTMFLPVKGEAPAPPLSHDHLPPCARPGGFQRASGGHSLFRWHASTLTTFLATATPPPSCPAPVAMAARCFGHTLCKTHTQTASHLRLRGLHPGCTLYPHLLHCTTTMPYFLSHYHFHPRTHRPPSTPVCTPHGRKLRRLPTGMGDEWKYPFCAPCGLKNV